MNSLLEKIKKWDEKVKNLWFFIKKDYNRDMGVRYGRDMTLERDMELPYL